MGSRQTVRGVDKLSASNYLFFITEHTTQLSRNRPPEQGNLGRRQVQHAQSEHSSEALDVTTVAHPFFIYYIYS